MTKEEQRMAIAEVCGYVWYRIPKDRYFPDRRYRFLALPVVHEYEGQSALWLERADGTERISNMDFMEQNGYLPSYVTDLSAMHYAERTLTIEKFAAYENNLCAAVDASGTDSDIWFYVLTATAEQRAEAFLRTVGRWKDDGATVPTS